MPASIASSSRRKPGARRCPPGTSPTSSGRTLSRRARRKSPSALAFAATARAYSLPVPRINAAFPPHLRCPDGGCMALPIDQPANQPAATKPMTREDAMTVKVTLPTPRRPYLEAGLLPADFYAYEELLSDSEREKVGRIREFFRTEAAPIVDDYWARAEFPFELVKGFAKLGLLDWADPDSSEPAPSNLLTGITSMEMAHADPSLSVFFGVHSGLAMGSIITCGSEEQKRRWLPAMSQFEKIGAFALTEPHGGSDVAGGMETTARRDGDEWVINGAKRWIGNATFADLVVIWARDVDTNHVLGFVVEKDTPGFRPTKIENKIALRIVQNADIVLDECRVTEANRLQNAKSFRDNAEILRRTRSG